MFSGVVVLYNPNVDEVKLNISTYLPYIDHLYIVDNSANADSSPWNHFDKKAEYISNGGNKGIAVALNIAARKAIVNGYNWLLTMDQDSQFQDGNIKILIDYINSYRYNLDAVGIVSPFHDTVISDVTEHKEEVEKPIMVMTSGNFVNLEVYKRIGGFEENYFIDGVDFDYGLRLTRKGYEIHQVNKCVMKHELGNTVKKTFRGKTYLCDNHNYIRRYYITRNRYYIIDKFKHDFPAWCFYEGNWTRNEIKRIVLFEKNKFKKLRYMYKGYRDYKKGITGPIKL